MAWPKTNRQIKPSHLKTLPCPGHGGRGEDERVGENRGGRIYSLLTLFILSSGWGNTRLPSALHAFLSLNATRYALLTYSEGFVRSNPKAYLEEGQIRYASDIYLMLVDGRTGKIIYFNRSRPEEADPLSPKDITRRIKYLLEGLKIGK